MNPALLAVLAVVWLGGAVTSVVVMKPKDAWDGAMVLMVALLAWPLFAAGWLVSRPWSK